MLVLGAAGTTMAVLALNTLANLRYGGGWGPEWVAVPVSTVVWWTLLTVLLTRHRALTRHGRPTAARLVVVAVTVVTPGCARRSTCWRQAPTASSPFCC
jgi:hypothetical protein